MSATQSSPAGSAQKQPAQKQPAQKQPKNPSSALGLDELLRVTGPRIWIGLVGLLVIVGGLLIWSIMGVIPQVVPGQGMLLRGDVQQITAPSDGSVETIPISENAAVKAGDVVATLLTADGTSVALKAAKDGVVTGINVPPGFAVTEGAAIMTIEDTSTPLLAVIYVPLGSGKTVSPGMAVQLAPSVTDVDTYGYLLGTVTAISEFPVTQQALAGNAYLGGAPAADIAGNTEPMLRMIITLDKADTISGYRWSSSNGPAYQLHNGTATEARVVVAESHPIDYFLPLNR